MRGAARILLLAMIVGTAGCAGAGTGTGTGTGTGAGTGAGGGSSANPDRTLRWSTPLHYHGVEIRLELPPGDESPAARIERLDVGDRIVCGDIAVSHRYQRFEVPGGGRHHFEEGSRVFVFRAPSSASPWETRGDRFALVWAGDGVSPVIQEDRRGGVVIWHFGRTRVERAADGTLLHHHRGQDQTYRLPMTLLLGPQGELLESRPSVR